VTTTIHLDTDLGGDPDDAFALALLLAWPGIEVTAITTNLDVDGERAGCVHHVLAMAGRHDIPVAAGAAASMTTGARYPATSGDRRHWPVRPPPRPSPQGAARGLLADSIGAGALVVTIGALTNLAELERARPGALDGGHVVAMGGWLARPRPGYPPWGPERDWNVQCDTAAAEIVLASGAEVTLALLNVLVESHLCEADLPDLRATGPLGDLLADQAVAYAADHDRAALAAAHEALPADFLNFHWDPVTVAVAAGWPGAELEEVELRAETVDGVLRLHRQSVGGRPARVVTSIDAAGFGQLWRDVLGAPGVRSDGTG